MTSNLWRSVVSASFLFVVSTASAVYAQSVSVPFPEGFIGTVGNNTGEADAIRNFGTLGIDRATFSQPSTNGQFGGTQGNDLTGTMRLIFNDGTVIDVPGAINWRITQGNTLHYFGFIPDPNSPPRTVRYGSTGQFSMTLNGSSNYGLRVLSSTEAYPDNTNVKGNAATSGLLDALNAYLAQVQANGPKIVGPSGAAGATASARTVSENQTAVATLTADRTVSWSVQGGMDAARFSINPTTGALTFLTAPDFEAPTDSDRNNSYVVTVLATDANGFTGQQTVTVTVADVDEVAPTIIGPSAGAGAASSARSVPENGTAVTAFAANETVTWSITGGADATRFAINPTTGALTFAAPPDFEVPTDNGTNNVYDLVVTARDAAGNTSTQSVAVTVTDLDEVAPQITGPSGGAGAASSARSVNEGTTAVHSFTANETVTWSIAGGADAARFSVNPTTGALTFQAAPDYEVPADAGANNVYDLIVRAVDAAGNASQQSVVVTVLDLDEVAPQITGPSGGAGAASAGTSVPENQTAVATFTASETVTWSITGGVDAARFAIDPNTGALAFRTAPDFEAPADTGANNVYDLVITARDAANNASSQSIVVTVLNLDEIAPQITGPSGGAGAASSARTVDENQTAVTTFTASEGVTWAVSGTDAARFAIDPSTGALTLVAAPDYEAPIDAGTNNIYDILVTARDAAGNVSQQAVTVTVANLDEVAPSITGPSGGAGAASSATSVNEGTTAVATFTADEGATWSISGGADAARFAVDPSTGALTFLMAPDYENPTDSGANNVYDVILTARDAAGNTSTQAVAVTVLDLDDTAPVLTGSTAQSAPENQTAVGTYSADEPVTWAVVGGADATRFTIDSATGVLTFVAAPDFEAPTDNGTNNVYDVVLEATDRAGNKAQQTVAVTVTDLDDAAPAITGPSGGAGAASSTQSVNEGTTAVHVFTASEGVTWSITGGADQARFAMDPSTGALTFVAAPDYEQPSDAGGNNVYDVVVTARDAAGNLSTQSVTVAVLDLDDTAPVLTGSSAESVPENQMAVGTYTADESVTWAIAGGADQARFRIDSDTGVLTFVAAPDFEQPSDVGVNNVYDLVLEATDRSGNKARRTVVVTVTDLDDTAPRITGPSGAAGAGSTAKSVTEGTLAAHSFTADEGVTWSVVGGTDQAGFTIDPRTGALRFVQAPDFEAPADADGNNIYLVTLEARDGSGNVSTQGVAITVTDIPEDTTPPSISGPSGGAGAAGSAITVNENGTAVTTVTASEAVTWSISGGDDQGLFAIDPATGALTFVAPPDFEAPDDTGRNNGYVIVVTATDGFGNTSRQTVAVTVADVNEDRTPPAISGPSGGAGAAASTQSVNEGQTAVHTFAADEGVAWALVGGTDQARFRIDPNTGALTFVAAPDFEQPGDGDTNNVYLVIVEATDGNGNTSRQTISVTVRDLDDTAPQITGPSGQPGATSSAIVVNEGQSAVVTFAANEGVTWAVTGGADQGRFAIDPSTGALTFVRSPDYEAPADAGTDNTYEVVVTATDRNGNASRQTVTVTVADFDEVAPAITAPSDGAGAGASALSVDEGTTTVATFSAGEAVTWALVGGADQGQFSIDPTSGALTFVAAPDYERPDDDNVNNIYLVTVEATDGNGNASRQTVSITVRDLDDTAPAITGPSGQPGATTSTVSVNEGTGTVHTFAADEGVSWSITGGADAGRFALDPNTGVLTFVAPPDFERPVDGDTDNDYVVVVTARDANGNTSQQTITVIVRDLAEDVTPPQIGGPSGSAGASAAAQSVREGTTVVHTFTSDEPVTWAIVGGPDGAGFSVDPTTGELSFLTTPDYEAPADADGNNVYLVTVEATDASGNVSRQTVAITVTDLNEDATPPRITGPSGGAGASSASTTVNENQRTVSTFSADEATTWSITGGSDAGQFLIDPATGELTFVAAPDYEGPTGGGRDNIYVVEVTATDSNGNTSRQTVTIIVANLAENVDAVPPTITGPSGAPGDSSSGRTVVEGQTAVTTFASDEPVTWTIVGGPDAGDFTINGQTGELSFVAPPDFEAPADDGRDGIYVLIIEATDANGNTSQQTVTVTVGDLTEIGAPPVITGPDGIGTEQSEAVPEGATTVATFGSDEPVTWSLDGGDDETAFAIDPNTGELRFVTPPSFDNPTDADRDNVYVVTVVATDTDGNRTTLTMAVEVQDLSLPAITGPSGAAGSEQSGTTVEEDTTAVATFLADEAVTWSISGGPDAAHFTIDPVTGALRFVAPPDYQVPLDQGADNVYVLTITATDDDGNTSEQTVTVEVVAVTAAPAGTVGDHHDEVVHIVQDVEENALRAGVAAQQDMTRSARDRLIAAQRQHEACRDLEDPTQPVTSAYRGEEECSLLASRNDVPFDVDGSFDADQDGFASTGTFFGQTGNFEGTRSRIVEGTFQLVGDGQGIETLDVTGRLAWERLLSEDVLWGAFVGAGFARSEVERSLDGTVDKTSLSFGTYVAAEPLEGLYAEGFLSLGVGRNELALSDEELDLEGDYMTRSLLVGGALSGVIERETFEIRPELAVAYGVTDFGDLRLEAMTVGGIEEATAAVDSVDYATIRLTPEILVPMHGISHDATLLVAPSLACEWADGDGECGGGLRLGLRGTSRDGLTSVEVSVSGDRIGDATRTGIEASFERRF